MRAFAMEKEVLRSFATREDYMRRNACALGTLTDKDAGKNPMHQPAICWTKLLFPRCWLLTESASGALSVLPISHCDYAQGSFHSPGIAIE